jgi:peroxiredoxin
MEAMLHIGDNAPDFTGKYYSSGNDFHLKDFIGRDIVIIDFWYTHCPPCVKAMPYLSDLSKRYKNKGLKILGLNSVDNQGHSMDNLKKFLNNRNIDYDVVLIEPEVDIRYKVNGYPTMYIIDKSGKIAYVELGFDEKKYEELEKKIGEMVEVKK